MNALDIIEQLEALSPAELQHEINEQRDRLALMERLYALLTGDSIKTGKRQPRKPKQPLVEQAEAIGDEVVPPDTTNLRRRLVDLLKALGPMSWTQLIGNAKAAPTVLGPALKAAQANGQIEKRSDGLYHAVGK